MSNIDQNPDEQHDDERQVWRDGEQLVDQAAAEQPNDAQRSGLPVMRYDDPATPYDESVYAPDEDREPGIRCDQTIFGADGLTVDVFKE